MQFSVSIIAAVAAALLTPSVQATSCSALGSGGAFPSPFVKLQYSAIISSNDQTGKFSNSPASGIVSYDVLSPSGKGNGVVTDIQITVQNWSTEAKTIVIGKDIVSGNAGGLSKFTVPALSGHDEYGYLQICVSVPGGAISAKSASVWGISLA